MSSWLRVQRVSVRGQVDPRIGPAMLRLALGWEIQARMPGGHSRETVRKLTQLAAANTTTSPAVPGIRLIREWNSVVHIVTVGEDRVLQ